MGGHYSVIFQLAYIDPGTGSYIFQIFIAFLLGMLFSLKIFWNKIKYFFKKVFFKIIKRGIDEA